MIEFLGANGSLLLVGGDNKGAIIDTSVDVVIATGDINTLLTAYEWDDVAEVVPNRTINLATSAIVAANVPSVVAAANRMYTIPGGVQAEAKKALRWRSEAKRGGTPVGLNTARTLAKGGQIGIEKVRHIAKYFPRHEVDKKGKGWEPGEEHFPSNGRIAWALWGGDAAWRWAQAIVERENKKALTAGGYELSGYESALESYGTTENSFKDAHEFDANQGPEFLVRVRHDGTGMDRLYMIDIDGSVFVWDDGAWDSLGHVDGDIYTYDAALDDVYDTCEKTHVVIDPASAIIIASEFNNGCDTVSIDKVNEEEAALVANSMEEVDWSIVEYAISASADQKYPATSIPKIKPIDTKGILSQPQAEELGYIAKLSVAVPVLTQPEIKEALTSWTMYVIHTRKNNKMQNITAAAPAEDMTPDSSDVPPKYLAIVTKEDLQAVTAVVALVPASGTSTTPTTYRRTDGQWVRDDQILADLKSATPPPVIKLDTQEMLNDVLQQADGLKNVTASAAKLKPLWEKDLTSLVASIIAAGGLDRNRGNAEELRQYWTRGKGALKIRWGTPGDWTRCVRHLSKYMGPRAKGYCQLRHKEATGVYTGSRFNPGNRKNTFGNAEAFDAAVVDAAALVARANDARSRFSLTASAGAEGQGARFTIPLLIPEGLESGDGRKFQTNAIDIRELPLPLLWQIQTGDGHNGSVVVGRIDKIERIEGGLGNAEGVFDTGPYGREAERLVRGGFLRGVSADLDQFEAKEDAPAENTEQDGEDLSKKKITINHARVMAATIVAKPAFQECTIRIDSSEL